MPDAVALKYRAFLSYSHADLAEGKRLHGQLEAYRLDRDLIGRTTPLGPVPKSLRPIFRDREDFSGGHSLTDATVVALDVSAALIVLCSTIAATRQAVNEEVRLFKHRHPDRPVVPVILDGTFPDNFPPALRFELAPDGTVTNRPVIILGPDLRDTGDGRALGLAKIVAGLTGLAPDDLYRRAERARRAANRLRVGVVALFVVVAAVGGYFWWDSQQKGTVIVQNAAELSAIRAIADKMLAANPAAAGTPGAKDNLVATLTSIQQQVAAGDGDYAKANELLKAGKGSEAVPLLIAAANAKKARAAAETKASAKAYREAAAIAAVAEPGKARELYAEAARLDPDNVEGMFQHAWLQQQAGNLAEAEISYQHLMEKGKRGKDDYQMAWANIGLGDISMMSGHLDTALNEYRAGRAAIDQLSKSDPSNVEWQSALAGSHKRIGDAFKLQGNLAEAWNAYNFAMTIESHLVSVDPSGESGLRNQAVSFEKMGDMWVASGNFPEALKSYRQEQTTAEFLVNVDPRNAEKQKDLAGTFVLIGDVLTAQGNLIGALKEFRDGESHFEILIKSDPENKIVLHNLAVSKSRIANTLLAQGRILDALNMYRERAAIALHLAETNLYNGLLQRDLATAYEELGRVRVTEGNLLEATKAFRTALSSRERLAKSDPGNTNWQRDLAVCHANLADVASRSGDKATARAEFSAAREISARLAALSPGNAGWKNDLAWIDGQLAALGP